MEVCADETLYTHNFMKNIMEAGCKPPTDITEHVGEVTKGDKL